MEKKYRILWLDNEQEFFENFSKHVVSRLREFNIEAFIDVIINPGEGVSIAKKRAKEKMPYSLIVFDLDFERHGDNFSGVDAIEQIQYDLPSTPILIYSSYIEDFKENLNSLRPIPYILPKGEIKIDVLVNKIVDILTNKEPVILHLSDFHFGTMHGFSDLQLSLNDTFFGAEGEVGDFIITKQPNIVVVGCNPI